MDTDKKPHRRRHRLDWEAIERDYRTDRFSMRELATKHHTDHATIQRAIKRDRAKDPSSWQKDLREIVRQATTARLMAETVTKKITTDHQEISRGHQKVTAVINAAAEIGAQVILGHRTELMRARELAMSLLDEVASSAMFKGDVRLLAEVLAGESATPADLAQARQAVQRALGVGARVSSVKALADAITKLHAGERVAFALDDADRDKDDSYDMRLKILHDRDAPEHAPMPPGS